MLIITRRSGESVFIDGERIQVMVLGLKGNQVRLGITAPKAVGVHREEVYRRIQREPRAVDDCPTCHQPSCRCETACSE